MSILQIRLKNCIQTLLELEPQMLENGETSYNEEFSFLKNYIKNIDRMELMEDEVLKLENITAVFLAELERSFCWKVNHTRHLQ